jgi:hypothetical protein
MQTENRKLPLLRVAPSGLNIIRYFSSRPSQQERNEGTFQLVVYGLLVLFRLQMCWLRVVAVCLSLCFRLEVCHLYLLKVPTVRPV